MSHFRKFLLRTNFEGPRIFRLFDFKISGTISAHIFRFMYDICISKHCSEDGLQKWVFNSQFLTFWSLYNFQHPMKSQIIDDKHSILCFCEQHHAHFTYNNEPTFQYENFLIYCHLKIVIFAKSGKFSDFLVILASHNPPINLQNTHIFGFAGTTPSLYNDFRKNLTLKVICSVMALIQNLKFFQFSYLSWQVLTLKLL